MNIMQMYFPDRADSLKFIIPLRFYLSWSSCQRVISKTEPHLWRGLVNSWLCVLGADKLTFNSFNPADAYYIVTEHYVDRSEDQNHKRSYT